MRQFILFLVVCFLISDSIFSQINYSPFLSKEEQHFKFKINELFNRMDSLDIKTRRDTVSATFSKTDSAKARVQISLYLDSLNHTKPYEITGSVGFNNIEDFKNLFGTVSIGARFRISKYKVKPEGTAKIPNRLDPHYVYFEYKTRTALSGDTNTLVKTFLFPQLNKQDYVFGYYHEIAKNGWSFWLPVFEFSLNKYSDKENKNYFTSEAFLLGLRVRKDFSDSSRSRWIMFMPYYKLINVDPKYKASYNDLLGETSLPSTFHTLGMELAFGPEKAAFFCNMNYVLNKNDGIKSPELIRFVYTVGVRALLSSNSFQIFK